MKSGQETGFDKRKPSKGLLGSSDCSEKYAREKGVAKKRKTTEIKRSKGLFMERKEGRGNKKPAVGRVGQFWELEDSHRLFNPFSAKDFMRVFKHGDALAIVIPESVRAKSNVKEGEEFEFVQVEKGVFALYRKDALEEKARKDLEKIAIPSETQRAQAQQPKQERQINFDCFVLETEGEAKAFSMRFEKELKSGEILGVRGFDKKYYASSTQFFLAKSPLVKNALQKGAQTIEEISGSSGITPLQCICLLNLLREKGEVIEKRKGIYKLLS
jgi:antitoxin component of MazEF toxin-antitoxin module